MTNLLKKKNSFSFLPHEILWTSKKIRFGSNVCLLRLQWVLSSVSAWLDGTCSELSNKIGNKGYYDVAWGELWFGDKFFLLRRRLKNVEAHQLMSTWRTTKLIISLPSLLSAFISWLKSLKHPRVALISGCCPNRSNNPPNLQRSRLFANIKLPDVSLQWFQCWFIGRTMSAAAKQLKQKP